MTLASMTGFARTEGEEAGVAWVWEVKSVNGKSLDLRLRLAPGFDALEPQLRALVAQRFRRGNFSASLAVTRTAPTAVRINREALAQLLGLMNELAGEFETAPPRLDGLLTLRGVIETVEDEDEAVLEKRRLAVLGSWATALDRLAIARSDEGARLTAVLHSQLKELSSLVVAAGACAAAQPTAIRERLQKMIADLADLTAGIPEERVAQEMAMLVARSDVREELDRLRAHLDQAGDLLGEGAAVGRRLDFLCQELNREANTLCAKSADIDLTRIGLSLKAGGRAVARAGAEHRMMIRRRGFLLVLSSPSGAGKTTIARLLAARDPSLDPSVSVTTRPKREGEVEGRDYVFIDRANFDEMVRRGALLEHATVFGNCYGTPRQPIEAALAAGRDVVGDHGLAGNAATDQDRG